MLVHAECFVMEECSLRLHGGQNRMRCRLSQKQESMQHASKAPQARVSRQASSTRTLLVDAYRLAGFSTGSVSLNGCFLLSPYTELDDAYTTAGIGFNACRAAQERSDQFYTTVISRPVGAWHQPSSRHSYAHLDGLKQRHLTANVGVHVRERVLRRVPHACLQSVRTRR